MNVEFTDVDSARSQISEALVERINERSIINDARALRAAAELSTSEKSLLST